MTVPYEFQQPAQMFAGYAVAAPQAFTGPLPIEVSPGHFIDLAKVCELDDDPKQEQCYALFSQIPSWERKGPHGVLLTGEARVLALTYWRLRAARTRAILTSLIEA